MRPWLCTAIQESKNRWARCPLGPERRRSREISGAARKPLRQATVRRKILGPTTAGAYPKPPVSCSESAMADRVYRDVRFEFVLAPKNRWNLVGTVRRSARSMSLRIEVPGDRPYAITDV